MYDILNNVTDLLSLPRNYFYPM